MDDYSRSWIDEAPTVQQAADTPINPLIVNGVTRSIRSHPYQVHLQTRYWWGGGSSCGGVIVDDYYVLTAAHCLEKSLFGYYYSPSEVKVTFYSSTAPRTSSSRVRYATETIKHPSWNRNYFENDIGLVRLSSPLDMSLASAIPLYDQNTIPNGTRGYATGWGLTSTNGSTSRTLQGTTLTITNNCGGWSPVPSSQVCATGGGSTGVCSGDSGGPMVIKEK